MELPSSPSTVTFDLDEFARALVAYRKAVAAGDPNGDLSLYTGFEVTANGRPYIGNIHMAVCNLHGEPISALVSLMPNDGRHHSQEELYAVITRHFDTDEGTWLAEQNTYRTDEGVQPEVVWAQPLQ